MSIIGKCIGATVMAIAGASMAAGDPTGATASPQALALLGGLATAVSGNLAHEAYNKLGDKFGPLIFARYPEIDRNHHIIIALRLSHLDAVEAILRRFNESRSSDHDRERQEEAERVSELIKTYLREAKRFQGDTKGGRALEEREVLAALPKAFETALADRSGATPDVQAARHETEAQVLAELNRQIGSDLPPLFIRVFSGSESGQDGWYDLFVRAAASRLKDDEAFKSIWSAEQLSRIVHMLSLTAGKIDRVLDGQVIAAQDAERRHDEQIALQRRILETLSTEKGVPASELSPILERLLGHVDVPIADVPTVLANAVDGLLAKSKTLVAIHNDYPEIDRAINEARNKLKTLDIEGALTTIRSAQERQKELQKEQLRAEARLHFEEADILRPLYDHQGVIDALRRGIELDPEKYWQWCALGDEYVAIGERREALNTFNTALQVAQKFSGEREISVCYDRIGDMRQAGGDTAGALEAHQAGLEIARTLAERDPSNVDWQRDLSISHNKIGDIRKAGGDTAGALEAYQASLDIRKTLAERDPSSVQLQRDLSVSHNKIGDMRKAGENTTGALEAYQASLDIRKTLAERDPYNVEWQRDLSVSYEKIGDMHQAGGDTAGALEAHKAGFDIAQTLTTRDPRNVEWQRDLSVSHNKIGDIRKAERDMAGALEAYLLGLDIRKTLAARDPSSVQLQRDLIVSHIKIAEINPPQATKHFQTALEIARRLYETSRLSPVDHWIVADIETRLAAAASEV